MAAPVIPNALLSTLFFVVQECHYKCFPIKFQKTTSQTAEIADWLDLRMSYNG